MQQVDATDHHEIEWQFDALDLRPVQRWLAEQAETAAAVGEADQADPGAQAVRIKAERGRRMVDTYADTETWALYRSGYTLRLRSWSGTVEATLKALGGPRDGRRRRREISQPAPSADPDALRAIEGPVAERVRAVAGRGHVQPLFDVRTLRTIYRLWIDHREAGEIALDQTTIPMSTGRSPARLRRVELEVRSEAAALEAFARELQEACRLQPARLSKFEAGVLAHGLGPPVRPELGPRNVSADGPIGELAFSLLGTQFGVLLDKEPGTRLGDDPEELHDMRVATRRLRAALGVFAEYLPVRAAVLRDELKWVAGALGEVRDLDVQREQLDEWEREVREQDARALEALRGTLESRRAEARVTLLEVLDSPRYARLVGGFEAFLRHGPLRRGPSIRSPALLVAPDLVESRRKKMRKAGSRVRKDPSNETLHRLRIRCKRLRYTLEFLTPFYADDAQPLIRALVKVQDLLGEHQDSVVAIERLRAMAAESGMPAETIFVMGRMAERYDRRSAKLRKRLPRAYEALHGGKWNRLSRTMHRERARVSPPGPSGSRHLRAVPATDPPPAGSPRWTLSASPVAPAEGGT
jgi:triphosphatase